MIAYHLQPPPAQREGGLDAAIRGLCSALQNAGVDVREKFPEQLERGSIVHMHGLWQRPFLAAAKQCREQGVPYIVSPHGMLEPWAWQHKAWKKWPYFQLVEKRFLTGAAALLATAADEQNRLRAKLPGVRVEALPLGMTGDAGQSYDAARAQLGWRPEERVLLYLSRLHVKKGLEMLFVALSEIKLTSPHRLVIVGDGEPEYVRHLHALAEKYSAKLPLIDWVGPVWGDARWPYFQGADLFCLPTFSENFGLAVLESLQVGTPVLTTRTTPWGATLKSPSGHICDPTIESILTTLRSALDLPKFTLPERASLAEWTRERFAWDRLAPAYCALYESTISRPE